MAPCGLLVEVVATHRDLGCDLDTSDMLPTLTPPNLSPPPGAHLCSPCECYSNHTVCGGLAGRGVPPPRHPTQLSQRDRRGRIGQGTELKHMMHTCTRACSTNAQYTDIHMHAYTHSHRRSGEAESLEVVFRVLRHPTRPRGAAPGALGQSTGLGGPTHTIRARHIWKNFTMQLGQADLDANRTPANPSLHNRVS
jgi:hypothetical protein